MKRIFSVIIVAIFVLGSVSCGRSKPNSGTDVIVPVIPSTAPTADPASAAPETPPALPSAVPTDAPTDVPTDEPADLPTETPTEAPTDAPTTVPTAVPTSAPTPVPSAIPTSAPTPVPSAIPTSAPVGLSFAESNSLPLPSTRENVPQGQPFCFGGIVKSEKPILSVSAVISSSAGIVINESVKFSAAENRTSVELVDRMFPKTGNASLTAKVKFETLPVGEYVFSLYAATSEQTGVLLKSSRFKVVKDEWISLISNNLRNNYAYALKFFGSRDEFMFRYKWANGRQITVETSWLYSHQTSVTSPLGTTWYVHKKAAPNFNSAVNYMNTTYLRVHGANDSGVIKLSSLIATFDGLMNTRFVSTRDFVSHHAFGTAVDLNASMDANRNVLTNRELIKTEVQDKLVYNGIKEANGIKYYDFTYTGSHSSTHNKVPTTIINYLLYELAFYRAGFGWGYYYYHACDAMHFSVSEMPASVHDTSSRSLRKVFSYI